MATWENRYRIILHPLFNFANARIAKYVWYYKHSSIVDYITPTLLKYCIKVDEEGGKVAK